MIIEDFQVHRIAVDDRTRWVMLELVAADGSRGVGEALLPDDDLLGVEALAQAARAMRGIDVRVATLPAPCLAMEKSTGLLAATVHATVDQCLWDLRARHADLPVYRMLGPELRRELTLYANINRGTRDRTPEGFAVRAAAAVADGFGAVKIAPFDEVTRATVHTAGGRAAFAAAVARVHAVREAMGSAPMLMIDCHCRLDLTAARRFLDATREARIDWFEDVLPYHDLHGWSRLKALCDAPLAGGETARGARDLLPFISHGIWDVLMPDVRFFGGITELASLAGLAAQHQLTIAPHNPRGPVGTLASAHAMVGCPGFHMLEYQYGECDWRSDLVCGQERIRDGTLSVPAAPGLGASLDRGVLEAHVLA